MLTDFEKTIYNSFLISRKKAKNQPFKVRHNFEKITQEDSVKLQKLEHFFNNNRSVDLNTFFTAPYIIYSCDDFFDLQFFLTRKALTCYTLYCRQLETLEPDTEENLEKVKESLQFVYKYCHDNNLSLADYNNLVIGQLPGILSHLKERKVNFYMIHGLNNKQVYNIEKELVEFLLPNFYKTLFTTQQNYIKSTKLKKFFKRGLEIIEKRLLKTQNNNIK